MRRRSPTLPSFFRASLCGLLSLLAACGGGGGSDSSNNNGGAGSGGGNTPTPTQKVAVEFTAPVPEEVFSANAPLTLSARVTVDGASAADGTPVQFGAGSGTAASTSTQGGVATSTLSGAAPGRQQLQASATVAGQTATAVRTVYLRPAPAPLEVLVPAYFYPTDSGATAWTALAAGASGNPGVKVTAIFNPANGVFAQTDPNLLKAATQFSAAGGHLLGYVYTSYGARSVAGIKSNIDNYLALYGRGLIEGIFLDEMASGADRLDVYREVYQYIKSKDPSLRVVGNPGVVPVAGYAAVADVLTVFEDKGSAFAGYDPRSSTSTDWLYTRPNSAQAALVHNVKDCAAMQAAVQAAASARYNTGVFYATHLEFEPATGVGNPWDGLPTYWAALLQTVRSVNAGQALPSC